MSYFMAVVSNPSSASRHVMGMSYKFGPRPGLETLASPPRSHLTTDNSATITTITTLHTVHVHLILMRRR